MVSDRELQNTNLKFIMSLLTIQSSRAVSFSLRERKGMVADP